MPSFGGEMTITLSTGKKLIVRANVTVEGSRYENAAVTNQDGSNAKNVTLKPYRAACSFEDRGNSLKWDELLKLSDINLTLVEDYTNTRHLWTKGFFEGTPTTDRNTGEITGIQFVSDKYRKVVR